MKEVQRGFSPHNSVYVTFNYGNVHLVLTSWDTKSTAATSLLYMLFVVFHCCKWKELRLATPVSNFNGVMWLPHAFSLTDSGATYPFSPEIRCTAYSSDNIIQRVSVCHNITFLYFLLQNHAPSFLESPIFQPRLARPQFDSQYSGQYFCLRVKILVEWFLHAPVAWFFFSALISSIIMFLD